ncbi:MAG: hypothetical protein GF307_02750 [candidate division Zixibacteria bacterium]|nr:hypothetical protein [candidate division Zixibacteria bacterium]
MNSPVGIRREDKNDFEARVPLTPDDMAAVIKETGAEFVVQPSDLRVLPDDLYKQAGAQIAEDISGCPLVLAVKEIPEEFFHEGNTYVFFSHTIKGQDYNMPMLRKLMELKCNLIDYEKITDEQGRRLIFFGRYAGLAGMIDTLWALGKRLDAENIDNPFSDIKVTYQYGGLPGAKEAVKHLSRRIKSEGIPDQIAPLVTGFAGYGNVSRGAQEIYDILPVVEIEPDELPWLMGQEYDFKHQVFKVVFKEEHMVTPVGDLDTFELLDYYNNPERYRSVFAKYLPELTVLVNCIFWDTMYPRLMTKEFAQHYYSEPESAKLKVIGDISVDIEGAVEPTVKATEPDNPAYIYDIYKDEAIDAFTGNGPLIMAVDNLPCELPLESSKEFSKVLKKFAPGIINADFNKSFNECGLPDELQRATVLYKGEFTPDFEYMKNFL